MKIKKILKNKTAFSAVIASLILMLLAVAAGVVVYAYVMGWIGGTTQTPTITGVISFDSISASNSTGITMYIRNLGSSSVTIDKIYVEGNQTTPTGTLAIPSDSVSGLLVISDHTIVAGTSYEVKVVCTDGATVTQTIQAQ